MHFFDYRESSTRLSNIFILVFFGLFLTDSAAAIELRQIGRIPALWLYNFGAVVDNDTFTIYRSASLGNKGLTDVLYQLEDRGMPLPRTVVHLDAQGYLPSDSNALEEFQAKESYGYEFFHSFGRLGERTYIDGFDPSDSRILEDIDSPQNLGPLARSLFSQQYPPGLDGDLESFKRVLELILDPSRQPVLFHCSSGKHRTGMLSLAVRYLQGGAWLTGPKKTYLGRSLNPAQYEYTRYNKLLFRQQNLDFIENFSQSDYFKGLKDRYQRLLNENR